MFLTIRIPIRDERELADAIAVQAAAVARRASDDLLAGPTSNYVRSQVLTDARAALRAPGDRYHDPSGASWTLHKRGEDDR